MTEDNNQGDDRAPVYFDVEADRWVVRMSDPHICVTAIVALMLGKKRDGVPQRLKDAYQDGKDAEHLIEQYAIRETGITPEAQTVIELPVGEDWLLRGHCDGYHHPYLFEYKNLGQDNYTKFHRKGLEGMGALGKKYASQAYFYCIGLESQNGMPINEVCFFIRHRVKGIFDHLEYAPHELRDIGGMNLGDMETKLNLAMEYYRNKAIPSCEEQTYGCPVWTMHNAFDLYAPRGGKAEPAKSNNDVLDAIEVFNDELATIRVAKAAWELLERREKEIKLEIQGVMEDEGIEVYTNEVGRVVYRLISSHSSTLDRKAMEKDGIGLSKYEKRRDYKYLKYGE